VDESGQLSAKPPASLLLAGGRRAMGLGYNATALLLDFSPLFSTTLPP
jgi:hypothetical protein